MAESRDFSEAENRCSPMPGASLATAESAWSLAQRISVLLRKEADLETDAFRAPARREEAVWRASHNDEQRRWSAKGAVYKFVYLRSSALGQSLRASVCARLTA